MDQLREIIRSLEMVENLAESSNESSLNLIFEGKYTCVELVSIVRELMRLLARCGCENALNFSVEGDLIEPADIEELEACGEEWRVTLNKKVVTNALRSEDESPRKAFFITKSAFTTWLKAMDPLNPEGVVSSDHAAFVVVTAGVSRPFGGPQLAVLPLKSNDLPLDWPQSSSLPLDHVVRQHVHILRNSPCTVAPQALALSWGDRECPEALPLKRAAAISMAASLVDVLYEDNYVLIKGVRHHKVPVAMDQDSNPTVTQLDVLRHAVEWVYEERVDTRKKLLADRLVLEGDPEKSFLGTLYEHLDSALEQARDQYRFVILDRKDEYARELRELLKDIREQADLYADKTRNLVNGLLRDALAAFVFVGLALAARLGRDIETLLSQPSTLFFKALAVYFIAAAVLQCGAAWRDIKLSRKELQKWANITSDYLPRKEREERLNKDLEGRRWTFWVFFVLVVIIYLALATTSWNLETILGFFELTALAQRSFGVS